MMFKAIYMHTKPLKLTKKHANTNELHQTNTMFSNCLRFANPADPLEDRDPSKLVVLGNFLLVVGCSLLAAWLFWIAFSCYLLRKWWTCRKIHPMGPKSTSNGGKLRQNDTKWMQNDSKMSPGGAWSALWGPRLVSSLFLILFDAILG